MDYRDFYALFLLPEHTSVSADGRGATAPDIRGSERYF